MKILKDGFVFGASKDKDTGNLALTLVFYCDDKTNIVEMKGRIREIFDNFLNDPHFERGMKMTKEEVKELWLKQQK